MRITRNYLSLLALCLGGLLLITGCASDPNVEGAKLNLRNSNFQKALDNISIALENNPQNGEAWLVKAQVHQKQMQNVNSLTARDTIFSNMVEALENAQQYGAEGDLTRQIQVAWVNEMQAGGDAFNAMQGSGSDTSAAGQAAERAVHHFENATEIIPDSTNGWVNLGYAHLASGNQDAAIEPLKRAIDQGSSSADLFQFLGQLYQRQEQFDQAIKYLKMGRQAHPDNSEILNTLLNVYVSADRIGDARAMFSQAVEEDPDNVTYRYNYGSLLMQAAEQTQNIEGYNRAIEQLERAVELDSTNSNALYNLGAAIQNKGVAYNDSISVLDDSLRTNQESLSDSEKEELNQQIKQLVQMREQAFKRAIPYLRDARRIRERNNEDPTDVCRALFQAYAQTNQNEAAKEAAQCAGIDVN